MQKCAVNGYKKELTITTYNLTTSAQLDWKYKKWEFTNWLCLRGDVARLHDRHQWQHDHHDCLPHRAPQHEHFSVPCLVHLVSAHRHTLHMHRMAQVRAVSVISKSSTCAHDVCGSPSPLISPFSSSFTSRTSCRTPSTSSPHLKFVDNLRIPPKESMASIDETYSLTGYEPNAYDFKETYVESYTELLTSPPFLSKQGFPEDAEYDDAALDGMLRKAHRIHVRHSQREDLSVGQSSSVSERTERPVGERAGRLAECSSQDAQIRILLDRQKERILAECQAETDRHEFQAEELQRRDQQLLHVQLLQQNWEFREAHQKSLREMEELKKFQSSTFDTIARRRLVEDQDTIVELSGRIQDLQNDINCMNDSKEFQDAESIRSGNSHVTNQPMLFPPHPIPEGMLRPSFVSPRRKEGPPSIWDTHGISGNVFVGPDASSSAPYPQELNQWSSSIEEPLHSSTVEKSEKRTQDQDQRCQSGPSAKDSVIFSGGDSPKNNGADKQRLQILEFHFGKFPTPAMFACWKIRFKTEVCSCSQFPTESMQWIKEVEMVDSVDDLKSSSSTRGIRMPNFEVLDARIASALNQIIHNFHFKRRISLEEQKAQKQYRFLRGRQIAYLIYEYFRVTGANDSVENYADLVFEMMIFRNPIQSGTEFYCQWRKSHLVTSRKDCTN